MFFDIVEAQYRDEYKLWLRFEDGSTGVANLSEYPNKKNVFREFFDMEYFKDFRIEYGTIVWGNGELDIAPESLYTLATGKQVIFSSFKSSAV